METESAYIRLSLTEGAFEIRGSEKFVSEQADRFEDLIHELLRTKPEALHGGDSMRGNDEQYHDHEPADQTIDAPSKYPRVFARREDSFQLTAKIPGSNNAEKTANIGLLLAYAHSLDEGAGVDAKVVREAAKRHKCLDANNFKQTFKSRNEHFLIQGSTNNYNLVLTLTGREQAEQLASELSAE